jgi:hypothetical protein
MPFRITHIDSDDKLAERLSWPILEQFYPRERLESLIQTHVKQTTHVRKLSVVITIYVLICWNLYLRHSLGAVFRTLSNTARWLGEEDPEALPTRGAWSYRRKQVGVELMRDLFEQSCGLLAAPETPGAFAFGLRLMAIDGTLEDVNDTPDNAAFFGRIAEGKTRSPYPQLRCLYLLEAGTHEKRKWPKISRIVVIPHIGIFYSCTLSISARTFHNFQEETKSKSMPWVCLP